MLQPPALEKETNQSIRAVSLVLEKAIPGHLFRLLVLLVVLTRLLIMPGFIDSGDGVYFVRGVRHYSTYELSPHWPGYPVYIWLGQLFHLLIPDPVTALHLIAVLASSLCLWPIAWLTMSISQEGGSSEKQAQLARWGAALIWALLPLSGLAGAEIDSDSLALLVALVLLWFCWKALKDETRAGYWQLGATILGGLLLGIRLSYVALLLPLAYIVWKNRSWRFRSLPGWLTVVATLLAELGTVSTWLGWQILMEGTRFFEAGQQHLSGHYQSWGGSLLTDPDWVTRPLRLLDLLVVYGLGGWWPGQDLPLIRLPLSGLLLIIASVGLYRIFKQINQAGGKLLMLWLVPYILWVLLSHDLNIARYCLPIVAALSITVGLGLAEFRRHYQCVLPTLLVALMLVSVPQALEYHYSPPPGERLATYLNAQQSKPSKTALVMVENTAPAQFLVYFVAERAPTVKQVWTTRAGLNEKVAALEKANYSVYSAQTSPGLLPGRTEEWELTTHLIQPHLIDSLTDLTGSNELWVYHHLFGN